MGRLKTDRPWTRDEAYRYLLARKIKPGLTYRQAKALRREITRLLIPELWNDVTRAQKRRLKADALEFEILSTRTIEWLRNDREMSRLEAMVKVAGGEGRVAALDKFIRRYKSK